MRKNQKIIAIPLGETIKEKVIECGMNQQQFASRIDMSKEDIQKLFDGEVQKRFTIKKKRDLCRTESIRIS